MPQVRRCVAEYLERERKRHLPLLAARLEEEDGEATAILAGDTLQTMAFDILSQAGSARAVGELARAAGA